MGTVAAVSFRGAWVDRATPIRDQTRQIYDSLQTLLNAWNPDSELSRLTSTNDWPQHVSPEVRPCYAKAFELMAESAGAFNPLLSEKLRRAGQTRRSALVDLGAIAKGFAVDCAYAALRAASEERPDDAQAGLLLDLGGNLRAVAGSWRVGVKDPNHTGLVARVVLQPGEALATSATYVRGAHILDGRTGQVVSNQVASVTVLASDAMTADGLSTLFFVLGPTEGERFLSAHPAYAAVSVLWVLLDGTMRGAGRAARFE